MSIVLRRMAAVALFGLAASLPAADIRALEGAENIAAPSVKDGAVVAHAFKTPRAALRAGLENFRAGSSASAIAALSYAAAGGETLAQWKLATIYAAGQGVPRDDLKAFQYFSQIIDGYDEDSPSWRDRSLVASAFVAIGAYSLNGIADSNVKMDPARARALFRYAAANFGDSTAQYNLARMYLDGVGGERDPRQGVRWLYLAADKGHVEARALLGGMLFTGQDGLRPERARALMWLTLAREAARDTDKDHWIVELYESSLAAASESERQIALGLLEDHLKRRN